MKQYLLKALFVAGTVAALPAFAQEKSDKKEKDMQTITIIRKGNTDDKTTIEIKGDKVLINGKEAGKNENITVNVHKFKPGNNMSRTFINGVPGDNVWSFNSDGENSFFNEDSNRAMLGVITDANDKGAEISSITKESAADKAGLKQGDVITKIGDKKIESADDVSEAVRAQKPADKVAITYLREGKEHKTTAVLGKWKGMHFNFSAPKIDMSGMGDMMDNNFMDMVPRTIEPMMRERMGSNSRPKIGLSIQDTEDGKGVKITDVDEESVAAKAGLKTGDIITKIDDKEVSSTDDVRHATSGANKPAAYSFKVLRGGNEQTIEVKIPRKLKTADL